MLGLLLVFNQAAAWRWSSIIKSFPSPFPAGGTFIGDVRITVGVLVMLALYVIVAFILGRTAWGRHVYAVGDDKEAAAYAGEALAMAEAARQAGVVTPEAVVLDFETAGLASRLLSGLIDVTIQFVLLVVVIMGAAGASEVLAGSGVEVLLISGAMAAGISASSATSTKISGSSGMAGWKKAKQRRSGGSTRRRSSSQLSIWCTAS